MAERQSIEGTELVAVGGEGIALAIDPNGLHLNLPVNLLRLR